MTTGEIRTLFSFNRWANDSLLAACRALSHDEFTRDLHTSYHSVRGTLVHILWAEWLWFARWRGESPMSVHDENDFPDVNTIEREWHKVDDERREFLAALTDQRLAETFAYVNRQGERWEYSYAQAMQHLLNHSTYHRGQIVTLLRQLGKTPPTTDFLNYVDEGGR